MFSIKILCVGKLSQNFLRDGCDEYLKRLSGFAKTEIAELPEKKLVVDRPSEYKKVVEDEGARILRAIERDKRPVIALCVEGKKFSSEEFSAEIERLSLDSPGVIFVIGGSYGLSEDVKRRAYLKLSFSDMTFTHQFARLILIEQIYRAFTIKAGISYHK